MESNGIPFFFFYCDPIVLKNIIPLKLYHHFLLLHVACRILCSDELAITHNNVAKKYLEKFVFELPHLYELKIQVINMNNLLHVADAKNFNCSLVEVELVAFSLKVFLVRLNILFVLLINHYHKYAADYMKKT